MRSYLPVPIDVLSSWRRSDVRARIQLEQGPNHPSLPPKTLPALKQFTKIQKNTEKYRGKAASSYQVDGSTHRAPCPEISCRFPTQRGFALVQPVVSFTSALLSFPPSLSLRRSPHLQLLSRPAGEIALWLGRAPSDLQTPVAVASVLEEEKISSARPMNHSTTKQTTFGSHRNMSERVACK